MSLRQRLGALLYDWPRYRRAIRSGGWPLLHNRDETVTTDGRGVRCEWTFSSDIHVAKVFPSTGRRLMRLAFAQWPVSLRDEPEVQPGSPDLTFIIGHRGSDRLPHLLATLRSIAGQKDASIECIVVEQSQPREVEKTLPPWVRYLHLPPPDSDLPYCRSWAFNAAARLARGRILVLHDNDMLVPARYAAELVERGREGWQFFDLKRFVFYLTAEQTAEFFSGDLRTDLATTIVQNLKGGSIAATREAYFDIAGFDESFVGWGGEDNDFWDRAAVGGKVYEFGYLPLIHLFHEPQEGKRRGREAPAVRRYYEIRSIPPQQRIATLRQREMGQPSGPSVELPAR